MLLATITLTTCVPFLLCRYGIGRFTTTDEVDAAVVQTVSHVNKLREMSPLWEMVQEGIDLKSIQWSQH